MILGENAPGVRRRGRGARRGRIWRRCRASRPGGRMQPRIGDRRCGPSSPRGVRRAARVSRSDRIAAPPPTWREALGNRARQRSPRSVEVAKAASTARQNGRLQQGPSPLTRIDPPLLTKTDPPAFPLRERLGVLRRVKGSRATRAGCAALDAPCALQALAITGKSVGVIAGPGCLSEECSYGCVQLLARANKRICKVGPFW